MRANAVNAETVATAGFHFAKGFAARGFGPDSVTLLKVEPSRAAAFTVGSEDHP
jgi:hypothetical protein